MKTKLLGLVAGVVLLGSTVAANASPYLVTLEEVGSNVVATGSGNIDLTGLSLGGFGSSDGGISAVNPNAASIVSGVCVVCPGVLDYASYNASLSGPLSFGSGGPTGATSGSGDIVGINASGAVFVPAAYISKSALSDGAIYDLATFASLGVTPGTYVWTWGTGADQSFTLEIGATPLPAALPLFATGLGALGLLGWRRKRKATALAA
jgi:hypothetical protein